MRKRPSCSSAWNGAEQEHTRSCPDPQLLQDAQQARDRLVAGYQPLVLFFAQLYRHRFQRLEMLDLIQEGNIGLLLAIDGHTVGKGHFTGLASCCIRHAMWQAYYESERFIRVSQKVRVRLSKLAKAERELALGLERAPTSVELAKAIGQSAHKIEELLTWREQAEVESLHQLLIDEEAEDKYAFTNLFEAPPESGECVEREAAVRQAIAEVLSPKQQRVVHWRYGFDGETGKLRTCEEVAAQLGVSFTLVARYDRQARQLLHGALAALVGVQEEDEEVA